MNRTIKLFYVAVFIFILVALLRVANTYVDELVQSKQSEYFQTNATELTTKIKELTHAKQARELAILQELISDQKIAKFVKTKNFTPSTQDYIFKKLQAYPEEKNSWIQFIDNKGISLWRSWDLQSGDDLSHLRSDVAAMLRTPGISSSISVGKYDMSFKTMIPIYDDRKIFIGSIELISNFDSIAQELENMGYKPLVLVDKAYKKQLLHSVSKKFVGEYYLSNKNADAALVSLVQSKGVTYFISPYSNYVMDVNMAMFNYAIFDQKDVFLGNILLAKDISALKSAWGKEIKQKTILFLVIFILLFSYIFYLFIKNSSSNFKLTTTFIASVLLFAVSYMFYFFGVHFYYKERENSFLSAYRSSIKIDFENISNKSTSVADIIYKLELENPVIFELLKKAQDPSQKDAARQELYEQLRPKYEEFKKFGVRELQFHLSNNESFLRMHKPEIYGDNLTNIRESVKWVNEHHQRVDGFEEGRVYSGFRHIFPLFYQYDPDNKFYMGSVEISFGSFNFMQDLIYANKCKGSFLIKSDELNSKLFESQRANYTDSLYEGWSFDKAVTDKLNNLSIDADLSLIDLKDYNFIKQMIEKGEIFCINDKDEQYLFTFIPLQNPVSKKIVAVLILQKEKTMLLSMQNSEEMAYFVGSIFLLLIFLYMYKEISIKTEYKILLRKTQRILDAQDSIVVIVGKDGLLEVNKKFLDFFGFTSLEAFRLYYRCISDKFLNDGKSFYIQNVENKREWIEELFRMDNASKIVSMMDKDSGVYYFAIKVNRLDENYLLELSDISDTVREKFRYINKAYTDALTGAYNREYFNANIDKIIHAQRHGSHLGIIFCDIDFFKKVNDTYGHDVGDGVLQRCVQIFEKNTRADDLVIRWGGEEFIILLYVDSMDVLIKIANTLRKAVEAETFLSVGTLTCSFGLSSYAWGEDILKAVKRADEALYEAKESGRNRVKFKF